MKIFWQTFKDGRNFGSKIFEKSQKVEDVGFFPQVMPPVLSFHVNKFKQYTSKYEKNPRWPP